MISTVTNPIPPKPAEPPTTGATKTKHEARSTSVNQESTQPKPQPAPTDTVKLSYAALMFAQEATETPTQTRKEAMSGDRQAQRLLAKEAAAQAASK